MITNGMPWFRMYHEMIDDPKVGTLDDGQFRLWVEMLCLACECGNSGDTDLTEPELNWKLRRDVTENILVLIDRGLVEEKKHKDGRVTFKIKNWEKRQFASDCSTARVQKYRQKNKRNVSETLQKRPCNVIDTDTDTNIKEKFSFRFKKKVPVPKNFHTTPDMIAYAKEIGYLGIPDEHTKTMILSSKAKDYKYKDWHAAWKTWLRNAIAKNPKLKKKEKKWADV
jgi:hypothetical protein